MDGNELQISVAVFGSLLKMYDRNRYSCLQLTLWISSFHVLLPRNKRIILVREVAFAKKGGRVSHAIKVFWKKLLKKHLSICEVYKLEKGISDNCIIMGMAWLAAILMDASLLVIQWWRCEWWEVEVEIQEWCGDGDFHCDGRDWWGKMLGLIVALKMTTTIVWNWLMKLY